MKKIINIFIASFFCFVAMAQQGSNLKIKDLIVIEEIDNPGGQSDQLNNTYTIYFKINNVSLAKKAYLKFGTDKDNDSILSIEPSYINQNGSYFLNFNNELLPVSNYTSVVKVQISNVNNAILKYLTLYLEDLNGILTPKLYFQIKP